MAKIGYHLIRPEALPEGFWQTSDEDEDTITRLRTLDRSGCRSGGCWLMWNMDRQAFYERRDLYHCSVAMVVDDDAIWGKATPCGDLHRREPLPIFFSVKQFWQIVSFKVPQQMERQYYT